MEKNSPREISIKASVVASLIICAITIGINYYHQFEFTLAYYLILLFLTFSVSMAVFYFAMEYFIYKKIRMIYKTISRLSVGKKKGVPIDMSSDVLAQVNKEVESWADLKSKEIDKLKETESYRKEFIGNLSHELKTPIFNIQGYILTLLEGAVEDEQIAHKFLRKASYNVERMTSLLEDLDDLIKLETSGPELSINKYDFNEATQELMETLEYVANKKDIKLQLKNKTDKPVWVEADKAKINQVLTNLIVNSINYSDEGGKTTIDIHDMDNKIMVIVADKGLGIEEVHLPRIFERFYRVDKSRSRHEGGSGLGLAIVKHIIEAHNQTINVTSNVGEGTTFTFTLNKPAKK